MAHRVTPDARGPDRRAVAGVAALLVGGGALGFAIASSFDSGGATPLVAAVPAVTPEVLDNGPTQLPPVAVPRPQQQTPTLPAVTAPVPTATQAQPVPAPTVTTPPPTRSTTPTRSTPTTTTRPRPAPTTPRTTTSQAPRPSADSGSPVPFRPDAATTPLEEVVIPAAEFPADVPTAVASLNRTLESPGRSSATAADIRYVLALSDAFGASTFEGRRQTIARILRVNAWWYARRPAPARRVLVMDPDGIISSYGQARGFAVNPVGTAGRWQRMNVAFSAAQLATPMLAMAIADDRGGRSTFSWEYYDVPDDPTSSRPSVSGMAQSRVAQLMAAAYRETGDGTFARAAARAVETIATDVAVGGATSMVAYPATAQPSPWYVERAYPGAHPWKGAALNGFMVTLLELRTTEGMLRESPTGSGPQDPAAAAAAADESRRLADQGAATLQAYLPLHDSGTWSYYGMLSPGHPWRTYLANASYHCYHVTLLHALAARYPERTFATIADRWAGYARRAGTSCPTTFTP